MSSQPMEDVPIKPIEVPPIESMAVAPVQPADEAIPPTDEAIPPADEAIPPADEAIPPADEAIPPADEAPFQPVLTGDYRTAIVSSVTVDLPNQHPTLVLRETESPRRQLSFSVGFQDGIGLSHALRRVPTPRPLTHELVADILQGFDIDVVAVRLVGRHGSIYFAELDLRGRNGRSVHSCRPSDAITDRKSTRLNSSHLGISY